MFGEHPELSSDIEWILLSGQADQEMLIETLVRDHGQSIHQILYAAFLDTNLVDKAVSETCLLAVKHTRKFIPEKGVFYWLLELSLPVIRKHVQKRTRHNKNPADPDSSLTASLKNLDWKVRLALYLHFKLDYRINDLSKVLRVRSQWIEKEFEKILREFSHRFPEYQTEEEIRAKLVEAWEKQDVGADRINAWLATCHKAIAHKQYTPDLSARFRESLVISSAILLILLGTWIYRQVLPDPEQSTVAQAQPTLDPTQAMQQIVEPMVYTLLPNESLADVAHRLNLSVNHLASLNQLSVDAQLTPGQKIWVNLGMIEDSSAGAGTSLEMTEEMQALNAEVAPGQPARTNKNEIEQLTKDSSPAEILARWQSSLSVWQSLFVEGQWVDYGPINYLGEARPRRFQAWIQQPSSSLVKIGPLDASPDETHLINSGMHIYGRPGQETQIAWWQDTGLPLEAPEPLKTILSPDEFSKALDSQTINITGESQVSGQATVQIEAFSKDHKKLYRFEIDHSSGILMNLQVYEASNPVLLAEISLVEIEYDPEINQEKLFDALRLEDSQFTQDFRIPFPEGQRISSSSQAVINLATRQIQNFAPAPQGFEPVASQILFQYAPLPGSQATLPLTTQVIADGYLLGQVDINPLQQATCRRSASGNTLAFFYTTGLADKIYPGIDWLNLHQVDQNYRVMLDYEIFDLAFRPDDKKLAVIARPLNSSDTGLYLLDHVTGESGLLLKLEHGSQLRWKPDGQYLMLLGKENSQDQTSWIIVHVDSGLVSFKEPVSTQQVSHLSSNFAPDSYLPPPEFPAWQWGVDLAGENKGLQACSLPGQ